MRDNAQNQVNKKSCNFLFSLSSRIKCDSHVINTSITIFDHAKYQQNYELHVLNIYRLVA